MESWSFPFINDEARRFAKHRVAQVIRYGERGDKLNLFGGGYTRTVIDSHIWDSLKGAVYGGPRYFEKIVVLNSFIK